VAHEVTAEGGIVFGSLEADLERLRSGLGAAPRSSQGDFSLLESLESPGGDMIVLPPASTSDQPITAVANADPNVAAISAVTEAPAVASPEVSPVSMSDEIPAPGDIPAAPQTLDPNAHVATPAAPVATDAAATAASAAEAPKQMTESESLKAQTEASRKAAAAMTATTNPADANQPRPSQVQAPKLLKSVNTVKRALSGNVDSIGVHLNNIVNDVSSIVRTKEQFKNALNGEAGAQAKAFDSAADKIKADAATYLRGQSARSTKDVLDCTACRFAWMHVEVDMGNTYSEKALYDAFVHHCAEMQMSRIFFSACNDMFVQVDDMIGDYLNGHTVNQLCMNARMCR
jgi:hypothetical protein